MSPKTLPRFFCISACSVWGDREEIDWVSKKEGGEKEGKEDVNPTQSKEGRQSKEGCQRPSKERNQRRKWLKPYYLCLLHSVHLVTLSLQAFLISLAKSEAPDQSLLVGGFRLNEREDRCLHRHYRAKNLGIYSNLSRYIPKFHAVGFAPTSPILGSSFIYIIIVQMGIRRHLPSHQSLHHG